VWQDNTYVGYLECAKGEIGEKVRGGGDDDMMMMMMRRRRRRTRTRTTTTMMMMMMKFLLVTPALIIPLQVHVCESGGQEYRVMCSGANGHMVEEDDDDNDNDNNDDAADDDGFIDDLNVSRGIAGARVRIGRAGVSRNVLGLQGPQEIRVRHTTGLPLLRLDG
jgi:hypothetical protein